MKIETERKLIILIILLAILQMIVILSMGCEKPNYDLNQDGTVDIKDLLKLQKHLVEEGK